MSIDQNNYQIKIGFRRLEVLCFIGVFAYEKKEPQKIFVSLSATLRSIPADVLSETVDYAMLSDVCRRVSQERPRELIETLAQDILNALSDFDTLIDLKISIEKPSAIPGAECAFIELQYPIEAVLCTGR